MAYTSYESFYGGNYSSLDPKFGEYFAGYRMNAAQVGFPGSPSTANQLGETVNALKQGVKAFEVSLLGIQGDPDQTIPKQHFKEMKALMKLSGVKPSVHGPVVDAAGFSDRGWGGEGIREDNERRMFDAIEKAHELDDKGNIPIVFHSTNGIPGNEYAPGKDGKVETNKVFAINIDTNQLMNPIEVEYKYRPSKPDSLTENEGRGEKFEIEDQILSANAAEWENKLTDLANFNKHADDIIDNIPKMFLGDCKNAVVLKNNEGEIRFFDIKNKSEITPNKTQNIYYEKMKEADIFLENVQLNFNNAFHKAYKYANEEHQKEYRDELKKLSDGYAEKMRSINKPIGKSKDGKTLFAPLAWAPQIKREILGEAINKLAELSSNQKYGPPEIIKPVEEFAIDKTIETFSNLAAKSFDKFQENAPVIAIENMYQGMAFSRAEDLKKIVEDSRDNFKKYLIKEKGFKEKDADKLSKEKIGVTWDVGHLNLMKKKGFTDEDIRKETEKVTPYVKHIHLTDNFGFADSHLPPGMGNVPIKEILLELEKNGKFSEMRKIVEAGNFVQHFKKSPHPYSLSVIGSPIYGMSTPVYWNQVQDSIGNYFGGYGTINPQTHHSLYGAGFTMLPTELGGQMPGTQQNQSRFGGTPMA